MAMNESSSKIRRFAPTRHIAQPDPTPVVNESPHSPNVPLSLSEQPDSKSIAAKQTYKLQAQINAQRGGKTQFGEITGNDVVARTARLQEEINRRRKK